MRQSFSDHPHSSSDLPVNELNLDFEALASKTEDQCPSSQKKAVELDLALDIVIDSLFLTESMNDFAEDDTELSIDNQDSPQDTLDVSTDSSSFIESLDKIEEDDIDLDLFLDNQDTLNVSPDSSSPTESLDKIEEDNIDLDLFLDKQDILDVSPDSSSPTESLDKTEEDDIDLDLFLDNQDILNVSKDSSSSTESLDKTEEDNTELFLDNQDTLNVSPDSSSSTESLDKIEEDNIDLSLDNQDTLNVSPDSSSLTESLDKIEEDYTDLSLDNQDIPNLDVSQDSLSLTESLDNTELSLDKQDILDVSPDSLSPTESLDNTELSLDKQDILDVSQDSLSPTESLDNTELSLDKQDILDVSPDSLSPTESLDKTEEDNTDLSPDNQTSEVVTPETNWFELACKLRGQNQELIQTVVALEQALAQAREDIQEQKQHKLDIEQSLNDTAQIQAPITIGEIENLKEDNQGLKGQIAELERECAVLKEENQEKTHQLTTSEGHIRELHSRLQRQQRYTLQYKAALEQYLGQSFDDSPETATDEPSQDLSIQPWSEEQIKTNTSLPQEPPMSADITPRSPSFQVNSAKIERRYHSPSPEPSKSRSSHTIIDLPSFLRRRSR
ncbi:MAG: hypothetical protein AB4058_03785 [Microcystaceae cyanobacterium]